MANTLTIGMLDASAPQVGAITLAFIRSLRKPYVDAVEKAQRPTILDWIPKTFPGVVGEYLLEKVAAVPQLPDPIKDGKEVVNMMDAFMVEGLVALCDSIDEDGHVSPWDIKNAVLRYLELSKLFSLSTTSTLPVEIVIGPTLLHMNSRKNLSPGLNLEERPYFTQHLISR